MQYANWDALAMFAVQFKPAAYLEVGVMDGTSVEVVLDHCSPTRLVLCDMWNPKFYCGHSYTGHAHVVALLEARDFKGQVTYLDGDSHELLRTLPSDEPFDLIHVDGDHSEAGAFKDMQDCWRLLAVGGHLVVDDLLHVPHVHSVFKKFCASLGIAHELAYLELGQPDGVGVLRKVRG